MNYLLYAELYYSESRSGAQLARQWLVHLGRAGSLCGELDSLFSNVLLALVLRSLGAGQTKASRSLGEVGSLLVMPYHVTPWTLERPYSFAVSRSPGERRP